MEIKIKNALLILGFAESLKADKMPKLKTVTKKYHKLAHLHHPDKNPGDEEKFKEITEAYRLVGDYIEKHGDTKKKDENYDFEEEVARNTFRQFQFNKVKENMRSFTILIENETSFTWDKVLTKHYGNPVDRQTNGFHWRVMNYTDGISRANIANPRRG